MILRALSLVNGINFYKLHGREGAEVITLLPKSKCIHCGGPVTILREVSLARHVWDILKPLEANADTINIERHLPSQFQLGPPKIETGMPYHPGYSNILSGESQSQRPSDPESSSPPHSRTTFPSSVSRDTPVPQTLVSPLSPSSRHKIDTPRTEFTASEDFASSDGAGYVEIPRPSEAPRRPSVSILESPLSPESSNSRLPNQPRLQSISTVSFEPEAVLRSRTVPLVAPPDRRKSSWASKLTGSRREVVKSSGDTSSISSTTLESQRLEELSLKSLTTASKVSARGKNAKTINVCLSQNSTYALFWTQMAINIWDVGTSSPLLGRAIATESNCVLAAVTKVHLAYIIGTRDQKLTVRSVHHQ